MTAMTNKMLGPDQRPFAVRFEKGPPRRSAADRGSRVTLEERQYMLYRYLWGVPQARIARDLGMARSTVNGFIKDLQECPDLLLGLRVYRLDKEKVAGARRLRSFYTCFLCGRRERGDATAAQSHIAFEFLGFPYPLSEQRAEFFLVEKYERRQSGAYARERRSKPKGLFSFLRRRSGD